jgi:ATP-binding cassette subfamily F protein 3
MISLVDIAKHYGDRTLFENVTLTIGVSERIGLVGPNGSGKSTLLEIIAGHMAADAGTVGCNKSASIGYLRQEIPQYRDRTVLAEMLAGHERLDHLRRRLDLLEEEMRQTTEPALLEELAARHGELEERFAHGGGYDLPALARQILGGLGFRTADFERPTAELSGGWLMRLALGRLLLTTPHLMLLDEPTNYLDLHSVIWLEGYLRSYEGSIIVVSHDRTLLNNIAQRIVEIDDRQLVTYTGNYDDYVRARALREEGLEAARKAQEREVAKTRAFIDRFRAKNTKARQVQSRIKYLERLETIDSPRQRQRIRFAFPEPERSSRVQIELRGIAKSYGGPPVYEGLDLKIERGERIVLVGPNGAGKSTLMKIVAGALPVDAGERVVGRGVRLAYFAQHQIEALDYRRTVLEELRDAAPDLLDERLRGLLGRFLFTADDVFKSIRILSGGEKARVALARLLVAAPNLLLLDEPTSHLDIPSRDVLEESLSEYGGTLVTISHDRHFIERLSTRVLEVGGGIVRSCLGTYQEYVARKRAEEGATAGDTTAAAGAPRDGVTVPPGRGTAPSEVDRRSREGRRQLAEWRQQRSRRLRPLRQAVEHIEQELEALTERLATLEREMADPEFYASGDRFAATFKDYDRIKAEVEAKTQRWEERLAELEALERELDEPPV